MGDEVKQLQVSLKRVTQERDDLARDVESLCLQGDSYLSFSSSSVLCERISLAEKQLSMVQSQVKNGRHSSLSESLADNGVQGKGASDPLAY